MRALALLLLLLLPACVSSGTAREKSAELPKSSILFDACPQDSGKKSTSGGLDTLTLPCVDGHDTPHDVSKPTGKPRVINLWASWCPPCGEELPAFVRLHEDAAGKLDVLGVITEDTLSTAVEAANELRVRFPQVNDAEGKLRRALGRNALPLTLFLDASGTVKHTYAGPALTDETLRGLVTQHLHVAV